MDERSLVLKYILLPNGGKIPTIGLGTFIDNQYVSEGSDGKLAIAIRNAISLGYRHIDTAWMYNTEADVGCAVKEKIQDGTVAREDLFIVTKLWRNFLSHDQVSKAFHRSLKELDMTYVDLYLIHSSTGLKFNSNPRQHYPDVDDYTPYFDDVDYVDTWKEMEELVDAGLVKSIGVSNFNIQQIERILAVARHPLSVVQVEMHPYLSQSDLLQFCRKRNIVVTAYSPLAWGGQPLPKPPAPVPLNENPTVKSIALKHKKSPFQVVLRYELQLGVAVIPKSTNQKHIHENFHVFDFKLSKEEMRDIASLNINYRLLDQHKFKGHVHFPFCDEEV
ncbi:aldo-keto reductase family 1 member B1-like [Anneissia japonica]|uniref:aldo-keto reductase family 1 member B1-like n=1 Tax=Anneissia japonica TaxID=1529436 RepID=UPI0014255044|nr:aldo-keto reductase family 1 member B1-like [Anneissia japonica]